MIDNKSARGIVISELDDVNAHEYDRSVYFNLQEVSYSLAPLPGLLARERLVVQAFKGKISSWLGHVTTPLSRINHPSSLEL